MAPEAADAEYVLSDRGDEIAEAYSQATAEAIASFGDGSVYIEKYIFPARHVELQILADEQGNVVCLGDRDARSSAAIRSLSKKRRPPEFLPEQRRKIIKEATDAVKQIGYVGAGTLEFLLDRDGNFWFMEMNVRLQVEHCVTEMLTGIDLVKWQIRVAAGIPINFTQDDIKLEGFVDRMPDQCAELRNVQYAACPRRPFRPLRYLSYRRRYCIALL